jgi:hypothetical protein
MADGSFSLREKEKLNLFREKEKLMLFKPPSIEQPTSGCSRFRQSR